LESDQAKQLKINSKPENYSDEILFCGIDGLYARHILGCNVDLHAPYNFLVKLLILTPKWPFQELILTIFKQ
jgi:hypothetical protein